MHLPTVLKDYSEKLHEQAAEIERLRAELDEATQDRNMVSDLIMENPILVMECAMNAHDAHSFWSDVREVHAGLKLEED